MIFSTLEYFIFFIVYFCLYKFIKPKHSIYLIIFGSLFFYGWWNPILIWVPAVLCTIAYFGAFWVNKSNENDKNLRIGITVTLLLLPLAIFKYIDFFYNDMLAELFSLRKRDLQLVLPLGISFISFTMIFML